MSAQSTAMAARAAIRMALTESREEEQRVKNELADAGIKAAAVDYGGEYTLLLKKGMERAVVAALREGLIAEAETEQGVVAGAAHEAIAQVLPRALGLSVGGKIGVARQGEHVTVAVFLGVGLLHLNDVAIAVGHRAIVGSEIR